MGFEEIKKNLNNVVEKSDDGEGEAVVNIGTREELDKMREKAEINEKYADVATFIRLNKEIIVPAEEVKKSKILAKEKLEKGMALLVHEARLQATDPDYLIFLDKDGNIARVLIKNYDSIVSLKNNHNDRRTDQFKFKEEAKKSGFDILLDGEDRGSLTRTKMNIFSQEYLDENKEAKEKNFNF